MAAATQRESAGRHTLVTGSDDVHAFIAWWRRVVRFGVLALGVLASIVIAIELCSYVLLTAAGKVAPRLRVALSQYEGKDWLKTMRREEVATSRYFYQPYIVWRRRPYEGKTISIDDSGLRRTVHSRCNSSSYAVFMFGGSALWGSGSPDWGTIPSWFAKIAEEEGRPVCVRNFGESGYVSSQEVTQLILTLKQGHKPDLVIFYDGWNDISARYQTGVPDAHANLYDIKQKFEAAPLGLALGETNTARLYDRLATGLRMRESSLERGRVIDETNPPDTIASSVRVQYLRGMEIVDALSKAYGFRYAFFWQPMILADPKSLSEQEKYIVEESAAHPKLVDLTKSTYRRMRETEAEHFFYFGDVFKDRGDSVYVDWVHIDPDSNRFIAQEMHRVLSKAGVKQSNKIGG